jgi:hypothetical protein
MKGRSKKEGRKFKEGKLGTRRTEGGKGRKVKEHGLRNVDQGTKEGQGWKAKDGRSMKERSTNRGQKVSWLGKRQKR